MFYEYPRNDLKRELMNREKNGQHFNQAELTHILYQQIAAQEYLEAKDLSHGDVQPLNISYDKANMNSKLIDKSQGGNERMTMML